MVKQFIWYVFILVTFGCQAAVDTETRVSLEQNTVTYQGAITKEANNRLNALINQHGNLIKELSITSKGGEVNQGMDLGNIVFNNKLTVVVESYCLSSCANYVFSAAPDHRISKHALIGFHGGVSKMEQQITTLISSLPEEEQDATELSLRSYLQAASSREKQFFEKINVAQRITTLGQSAQYDGIQSQGEFVGWYYSIKDMTRLGVRNIEVIDPPWSYKPLSDKVKFFRINVGDLH